MSKNIGKRNCKICEKEINIVTDQIGATGSSKYNRTSGRKTMWISPDGVLFQLGGLKSAVWFCNNCWEQLTKKVEVKPNG